jgi:tetratricopeptide (TPR) repeat protein
VSPQSNNPPEVFVSYSHKDNDYKDELVKQLNVLEQQGVIANWHDGLLVAGQRWNDEIVKRLKTSRIILLLISADFLNSVYINNVEIEHASRRYQAGEVIVIPVLVRNVNGWKGKRFGEIKLGDLQALPTNAKFIKQWKNRDEAFADVAAGIQKAVEKLKEDKGQSETRSAPPPQVPTSHLTEYVRRHDEKGRDILERLKEAFTPGQKGLIALWGKGGVGKTRIAAEAASALTDRFKQRIVWASAEKRSDFTFSTLLDEIAKQLDQPDLLRLAQGPKEESVLELIASAPAFVVLDNFETVESPDERAKCVEFLIQCANCYSLITSRQKIASARNIPIKGMSSTEAHEFLEQLIEQTQEPGMFTRQVRSRIIKTAESNPYIMLWMVAQIDDAQTPKKVLDELEQGKGEVAERVFDRSFNLRQLGDDGRAALLALALFVSTASREALSEVAGFGDDMARLDEAAKNLRTLWLITTTEENERLSVEGLTRSLSRARLSRDAHADEFRQRFVAHFLNYAEARKQKTPEDFNELEVEKDNVLGAMDLALELENWPGVTQIRSALEEFLDVRGYWQEAIVRGEQALKAARTLSNESLIVIFAHNLAVIYQQRGELVEAGRLYDESLEINKKLGNQSGIAISLHQLAMLAQAQGEIAEARRLYDESLEISKKLGNQTGIANTLGQLGMLAQDQGELVEARRLYDESLEINKKLGNQTGIAITLHNLAAIAQAQGELVEARRLYDESLEIKKKLGDQSGIANTLHQLGMLAQDQGELVEARRFYDESLEIKKKLGNQSGIATTLGRLGLLAMQEGNRKEAVRLLHEALSIFKKLKSPNAEIALRILDRLEKEGS